MVEAVVTEEHRLLTFASGLGVDSSICVLTIMIRTACPSPLLASRVESSRLPLTPWNCFSSSQLRAASPGAHQAEPLLLQMLLWDMCPKSTHTPVQSPQWGELRDKGET